LEQQRAKAKGFKSKTSRVCHAECKREISPTVLYRKEQLDNRIRYSQRDSSPALVSRAQDSLSVAPAPTGKRFEVTISAPTIESYRFFFFAAWAPFFPSAVLVRLGRWATVRFFFAALAAFLILRRAALFCLLDVIDILHRNIAAQTGISRSVFKGRLL
jgi:hypothetical protein